MVFNERQPLVKEDLRKKITQPFDRRHLSTEETFLMEDKMWWKLTLDGRWPFMDTKLRFIDNGRRASMKDNISWNIIFKEIQTFALDFRMGRATNWFKVYLASAPTLFGPLLVTKHPLWLVHINVKQQKIVSHTIVVEGNNFILFPAFSSQRDQVLGINKVRNLHKVHLGIYVQ